jgi:hypothetical protein
VRSIRPLPGAWLTLGVAAVVAAALFASAPRALSWEYLGAKWPDSALPVPYCVNPNGIPSTPATGPIMPADAFVRMVRQAFDKWQDLPDSYITFRYTGICGTSPMASGDGVNTVGWGTLGGSAAGLALPGASRETPFRRSPRGDLLEVDLVIDDRTPFGFDRETYLTQILPVIILHEIGHFLGLGHTERTCAVMHPTSLQKDFCDDDIEGVRSLYPGPEKVGDLRAIDAACAGGRVSATLAWTPSREAEGYWVDLAVDPGFGFWFALPGGDGRSSGVRVGNLAPNYPHYWRVWNYRGELGNHVYAPGFVTPICFGNVAVPAGPPDVFVSTSCGFSRQVVATFSWSRSLAADGYYLDLTLDPGFGAWLNVFLAGQENASFAWSGLLPGAEHFARVFAFNGAGGFHSFPVSFRTPAC